MNEKILMEVLAHCLLVIRDAADAGLKVLSMARGGGEDDEADELLQRLDPPTFGGKKSTDTHDDEEAKA